MFQFTKSVACILMLTVFNAWDLLLGKTEKGVFSLFIVYFLFHLNTVVLMYISDC